MRGLTFVSGLAAFFCLSGNLTAQDYDEDDPVRYDWRNRDYLESGHAFGSAYYPRSDIRYSPVPRWYDNRDAANVHYPPADVRDRLSRNYGPPEITRYRPAPVWGPYYDDPDPFDNAYGRPRGRHYIEPEAENFRGGRYATDYPGFRGGWYGREHRVRIRAGEYTAGDYANAFWDHQHHRNAYPGEHVWNANWGRAY
jgi:hypothetical protein